MIRKTFSNGEMPPAKKVVSASLKFEHLVNDLLWSISEYLDYKDRASMQCTSHYMQKVFHDPQAYTINVDHFDMFIMVTIPLEVWSHWEKSRILALNMYSDFSCLKNFGCLKKLIVGPYTCVRDITPFTACVHLESLDIHNFRFITDITPLAQLHRLRELYINNTQADFSPLYHLPLQEVSLELCDMPTFQSVRGLTSLKKLYAEVEATADDEDVDLSTVSNMTGLRNLTLTFEFVRTIDLQPLSGLTNLTDLHILSDGNFTNWHVLSSLTNLKKLHLSGIPANLMILKPLQKLVELTFSCYSFESTENCFPSIIPLCTLSALEHLCIRTPFALRDIDISLCPTIRKQLQKFKSARPNCVVTLFKHIIT